MKTIQCSCGTFVVSGQLHRCPSDPSTTRIAWEPSAIITRGMYEVSGLAARAFVCLPHYAMLKGTAGIQFKLLNAAGRRKWTCGICFELWNKSQRQETQQEARA